MIEPKEMTKGTETSIRAVAKENSTTQPTREQLRTLLREIDTLRKLVVAADGMRRSALTGASTATYDFLRWGGR